jgi:hypothetical protein
MSPYNPRGMRMPARMPAMPARMPAPAPVDAEHPKVRKSKRQTMTALAILCVLLIAVTMTTPEQAYSENSLVRMVATYKQHLCLFLSVIILLIVARHYNIAREYTNWVPFVNEYYYGTKPNGTNCSADNECQANRCVAGRCG